TFSPSGDRRGLYFSPPSVVKGVIVMGAAGAGRAPPRNTHIAKADASKRAPAPIHSSLPRLRATSWATRAADPAGAGADAATELAVIAFRPEVVSRRSRLRSASRSRAVW